MSRRTKRIVAVSWLFLGLLAIPGCNGGGAGEGPERVILITLDTTRADRLGAYGSDAGLTPNLDRLAEESVVFEQVVSPLPTTLGSHSTIMTGLYPPDHGVLYNLFYKLDESAVTLAEHFQSAGYATAAFPATKIVSERFGLSQGFDHWVEPAATAPDASLEHPLKLHRSAEDGVNDAIAWLSDTGDRDEFVWLHFYDPHWPYEPPFPYSSQYKDNPYNGEIAYTDSELGRLFKFLRDDPKWQGTTVVVTADHGEGLYEHKEEYHSLLVYETTQSVPLLIRTPGRHTGRIEEPVTLADITPTLLGLANLSTEEPMRGISLRGSIERGEEPPRRDLYFQVKTGAMLYGWAELEGVRYGDWKLIDSLKPELFNLADDPEEKNNLFGLEDEKSGEMRKTLELIREGITAEIAENAEHTERSDSTMGLGYVDGSTGSSSGVDAPQPRDLVYLQSDVLAAQTAAAQKDWGTVRLKSEYILEQDPGNRWALRTLATAFLTIGELDDALAVALRLRDKWPEWEDSYRLLANVHAARGDSDKALAVIREGLVESTDGEESSALVYLEIVALFELQSDLSDVCKRLVPKAQELEPRSSRLKIMEARCALADGDNQLALAAVSEAMEYGFRHLSALAGTPEFEPIKDDAAFRALLSQGVEDAPGEAGE